MTEATKESNKALESISQSMVAVGKSIKDGLALHVTALSGVQTQQTPQGYAEYSPGEHNYAAFQFSNSFSRNLPYDHHRISFLSAQNEASISDSSHNLNSPREQIRKRQAVANYLFSSIFNMVNMQQLYLITKICEISKIQSCYLHAISLPI